MMRIIAIYIVCIVSLFFLPVLTVRQMSQKLGMENQHIEKIKLLHTETGEIKELDFDAYIMGVLVGEMPVDYELEALKAQAVVARTYALNKMMKNDEIHKDADMCDDINHCQAYKTQEYALKCWDDKVENEKWNKIKRAVLETKNEVITYHGSLINAFFHANSGGRTEDISNIWGHEDIPYLKSVESEKNNIKIEQTRIDILNINSIMKDKYADYIPIEISGEKNIEHKIKILEKNSSGRIDKIQISNILLDGTEMRTLFKLRSTMIDIKFEGNTVLFETRGYGHGIGLSQDGANEMASNGLDYKSIIKNYYIGVEINTRTE